MRRITLIKNKFIVWDGTSKLVHLIISQRHFYEDAIWFLSSPQRGIYLCNALTTDFQSTHTQTQFHFTCGGWKWPSCKVCCLTIPSTDCDGEEPWACAGCMTKGVPCIAEKQSHVCPNYFPHHWHSEQNSLPAISLKTTGSNVINI